MDVDRDNEQFNNGVTHTVELLAKMIGATGWVAGDGSEDYDEDLGQTLLNILAAKGLFDPDTASYAALPAQEWQDISTAPKDGNPFLATDGIERVIYVLDEDTDSIRTWLGMRTFTPTHWMPLPSVAIIAEERGTK